MSGPQVIHQQRGVAVGPHFWGVRGLAQALLQAVWMGNPGWVLWCLSCSLPGAHTHTHTHTHMYMHRDKCHMQTWIWAGLTPSLCSRSSHEVASSQSAA